jgi:hypothetical protein
MWARGFVAIIRMRDQPIVGVLTSEKGTSLKHGDAKLG